MSYVKCRDYDARRKSCRDCDITSSKQCDREIDLDTPKKFVYVERRDTSNTSWNVCPTCGNSISYRPEVKDFRCSRCGQRIVWR